MKPPIPGLEGINGTTAASGRIATALLVDDESESRQANLARLEEQGYVVTVAHDEVDALSRVKLSPPSIIFVHLMSTGLGNLPFIQALRSDDACRHIPVAVITDHRNEKMGQKKLRAVNRDGW